MNIVPYVWMGDHWSLPNSVMRLMWNMMVEDKTDETVFCSGVVGNEAEFIRFMQNPGNVVMTQWIDDDPVFIGWLNSFSLCSASAHFNCFSRIWGTQSREAMQNAVDYWFGMMKQNGDPLLQTIIGMIPDDNQRAIKSVSELGFTWLGTIPGYSFNIYTDKPIGMTVGYIKRS